MINAGELDRSITLLGVTDTMNDFGETVEGDLTEIVTVWAAKKALRMADHNTATAHGQVAEAKFVIRWREGVTNKLKVRFEGVDHEIISVEELGRKQGLVLLTRVG